MTNSTPQFVLVGNDHERLAVQAVGRVRPDVASGDDGNWLEAAVEILAGGFSGVATCSIRTEDLAEFRSGLALMMEDASATAAFKTMENRLAITVSGDREDSMTIEGHVVDSSPGNRIEFRIQGRRDGLQVVLGSVDAILGAYPVS